MSGDTRDGPWLNIGCGTDRPEGWINADRYVETVEMRDGAGNRVGGYTVPTYADLTERLPWDTGTFTLAVCNHVLSDLDHHQLPHALAELCRVLRPGGVLRILVPDLLAAFHRYQMREPEWFPQDERTGSIDARFCTFVTWYGESRSVFTRQYLRELLHAAGFAATVSLPVGATAIVDPELAAAIVSLDGDRTTALRIEAQK